MIKRLTTLLLAGALTLGAQSYDYDDADRLIRIAYLDGGGIAYSYDDSNNMTAAIPLSLPAAPSGVEVTRLSPTSARIDWTVDASALGYIVERQRVGTSAWEEVGRVGRGVSTLTDDGLTAGVDYDFRVIAIGADGNSAPSPRTAFGAGGPPRPSISQDGIVDGAAFAEGQPVAPGSIISVFGSNIGARVTDQGLEAFTDQASTVPLPTNLSGAALIIAGEAAPLFFIGGQDSAASSDSATKQQGTISGQVNAQVPWEVPLGMQEVILSQTSGGETAASESVNVAVARLSPAFFTFDFGPGRVVGLNVKLDENDDVIANSITQPTGAFPGAASQPAKLGGVVTLFANGLGPTDPEAVTGQASTDAERRVVNNVRVFVDDAEAQVLFAGLTPQFVGLYQINIVIPAGALPGGAIPIRIEQGGLQSRPDVTIAIRP